MGGLVAAALMMVAGPPAVLWMPRPDDSVVVQRIRGQLSDLPWRLDIGPRAARIETAPLSARAAATVSTSRRGDFRLRLQTSDGRRWRRDVNGLGLAANREAAALILRSALMAIDEGIAPDWTEEPSPPAVTSTPEKRSGKSTLGWGWFVGGRTEANGYAVPAALTLEAFHRWNRWSLAFNGQGRWPMTVDGDGVDLTIQRYDAAVVGGFEVHRASAWSIGLRAGGGPTLWHRRSETAPQLEPVPAKWLAGGRVTAGIRWGIRLAPGWGLVVEGGADALFGAPRWTLADGTTIDESSAIQPWVGALFGMDPIFAADR